MKYGYGMFRNVLKIVSLVHIFVSTEEHDYSLNLVGREKGTRLKKKIPLLKSLCRKQNNTINFKSQSLVDQS
jgi:hypothetical protein